MQNFNIKNNKLILAPGFGEKINGKSNNNYIALFNTENTSMFSYVEFDGLSINNLKNISGSISTYESDIKIDNCKFKNFRKFQHLPATFAFLGGDPG